MTILRAADPAVRAAKLMAVALAALAVGACDANGGDAGQSATTVAAPAAATIADTDIILGDPEAPVTIIEFASVTCPGCAAFPARFLPDIKRDWIDTGRARLVFREFPTPPVRLSVIGSVLARCAADQTGGEGYFAVIGSLFQRQADWVPNGADHKGELLKITQQVGIDEAGFESCLQRQELVDLIYANVKSAEESYQINSTPSFVVNGEKKALRSLEDWDEALRAAYKAATGEAPPAAGEES